MYKVGVAVIDGSGTVVNTLAVDALATLVARASTAIVLIYCVAVNQWPGIKRDMIDSLLTGMGRDAFDSLLTNILSFSSKVLTKDKRQAMSVSSEPNHSAFTLTNCGLVTPCGDINMDQHWLR